MSRLYLSQIFSINNLKYIFILFLVIILLISLVKCFIKKEGLKGEPDDTNDRCPNRCILDENQLGKKYRDVKFPLINTEDISKSEYYYQMPEWKCKNNSIAGDNLSLQHLNNNCTKDSDCIQCGLNNDKYWSYKRLDICANSITFPVELGGCPKVFGTDSDKYFSAVGKCGSGKVVKPNINNKWTVLPEDYKQCKHQANTECMDDNKYLYSSNLSGLSQTFNEEIIPLTYLDSSSANLISSAIDNQYETYNINMTSTGNINWADISSINNYTSDNLQDYPYSTNFNNGLIIPNTSINNTSINNQCGDGTIEMISGKPYCKHKHLHASGHHL